MPIQFYRKHTTADKRREYKVDITSTNFRNADSTLSHPENYRLTVSPAFKGCFSTQTL